MVDRTFWYPGAIPTAEMLEQQSMQGVKAMAACLQSVMGPVNVADGLACTPGTGLNVILAPGSITGLAATDASAYGPLPADTSTILQQYLQGASVTIPVVIGTTTIYALLQTSDTGSIVLPYYNAASPLQSFGGPGNNGTSQPTIRAQSIAFTTTNQTGAVPLWTVNVPNGSSSVSSAMIAAASGSPFLAFKLPQINALLVEFFSNLTFTAYSSSQYVTAPTWAKRVELIAVGGGGGGGNCNTGNGTAGDASGSGGGAGGYAHGVYAVAAGATVATTIGSGGPAQGGGGTTTVSILGTGTLLTAAGGYQGGFSTTQTAAGGYGGSGSGGNLMNLTGGDGSDGQNGTFIFAGNGADGPWGGSGRAGAQGGKPGTAPGAGGGGAYDVNSTSTTYYGGLGAGGIVLLRWLPL